MKKKIPFDSTKCRHETNVYLKVRAAIVSHLVCKSSVTCSALVLLSTLSCVRARSLIDPGFAPRLIERAFSVGSVAVGNDGATYIAGHFNWVQGVPRNGISRLKPDGTIDLSFNPGVGANARIGLVALQADGKLIVAGSGRGFSNGLVRLQADGSVDDTFRSSLDPAGVVSLVVLPGGKLLVAQNNWNSIIRLNSDGSHDQTFQISTLENGSALTLKRQADGKILIAGNFTKVNAISRKDVARLNPDGSVDESFDAGSGVADLVPGGASRALIRTLAVDDAGRVLVGGGFRTFNGRPRECLARLNGDGSLDESFTTAADATVWSILISPDRRIFLGGDFTQMGGLWRNRFALLDSQGLVAPEFNPSVYSCARIPAIAQQQNGNILAGGAFIANATGKSQGALRFDATGKVEPGFAPKVESSGYVTATALDRAERVLVAGGFYSANEVTANGLTRLNSDGSTDTAFAAPVYSGGIYNIRVLSNDQIVVAGELLISAPAKRVSVVRLHPNGSLDTAFNTGEGATYVFTSGGISYTRLAYISAMVPGAEGKIYVTGNFQYFDQLLKPGMARLNANGSVDASFQLSATDVTEVSCLTFQPDGRFLLSLQGQTRRVARFTADGQIDPSFTPFTVADASESYGRADAIVIQSDGKILVHAFSERSVGKLVRLNTNGTIDMTFSTKTLRLGGGHDYRAPASVLLEDDGRILIAGQVDWLDGNRTLRIARLWPGGELDYSFNMAYGFEGFSVNSPIVNSVVREKSGAIVVGGDFLTVDGIGCTGLVRLIPRPEKVTFLPTKRIDNELSLSLATQPGKALSVETSAGLNVWQSWTKITATNSLISLKDSSVLQQKARFYRAILSP